MGHAAKLSAEKRINQLKMAAIIINVSVAAGVIWRKLKARKRLMWRNVWLINNGCSSAESSVANQPCGYINSLLL